MKLMIQVRKHELQFWGIKLMMTNDEIDFIHVFDDNDGDDSDDDDGDDNQMYNTSTVLKQSFKFYNNM